MTQYETILWESDGRIVRITLNRPDKRNALSDKMLEELDAGFARADAEASACCVILRGSGDKAFCAGADLSTMNNEGFWARHDARGLFPKLFRTMHQLSKPILAAVNGHCLAGGVGLLSACDLAIARSGVKIGTPEIARGLFPYMISPLILRAAGRRKGFELMLLGESISAEEAAEIGLVNKAVASEQFDAAVEEWARKLSTYSPAVLRLGRRALIQQADMPVDVAFDYLQGLLTINTTLEDAAEGIAAFFEKREPVFKGR